MAPRVFYPSCTVAIGLRFDDALHYIKSAAVTPETEIARRLPPSDLQPLADSVAFRRDTDARAPVRVERQLGRSELAGQRGSASGRGFKAGIVTRGRSTWSWATTSCHSTLASSKPARSACSGTVTPESFAQGVVERADLGRGRRATIVRPSIINGTDAQGHPDLDKLAIWGDADEFELKIGENPTLQIKGRDLRCCSSPAPCAKACSASSTSRSLSTKWSSRSSTATRSGRKCRLPSSPLNGPVAGCHRLAWRAI